MLMWNDERKITAKGKRMIIYIISISITVLLFIAAYRFIILKHKGNIEVFISAAAVILTIVGYILSVTNNLIEHQKDTAIILTVDVATKDKCAIFTCSIENKGLDPIRNMEFYLFIDQPILNTDTGVFNANHVLKHDPKRRCSIIKRNHKITKREYNCQLSKLCLSGKLKEYPKDLKNPDNKKLNYRFKKLDYLSPESILYINSGERFSEDVVVQLEKGVYRVILVGIYGKKKDGCSCANKQFIIE